MEAHPTINNRILSSMKNKSQFQVTVTYGIKQLGRIGGGGGQTVAHSRANEGSLRNKKKSDPTGQADKIFDRPER